MTVFRRPRPSNLALAVLLALAASPLAARQPAPSEALAALIEEALAVSTPTQSAAEYQAAAESYRGVLDRLKGIDRSALGFDDEIDADLLERHVRTRRFEIEDLRLHELNPGRYLALHQTDSLFLRPCANPAADFEAAEQELRRLPEVLANGRANLTRPAREWTDFALLQARSARYLLEGSVPRLRCDQHEAAVRELQRVAAPALAAVGDYETWLRDVLLPRSDRPPTWKPEEIEFYQLVHEDLVGYDTEEMLWWAEREVPEIRKRMENLARQVHPSGDVRTVWELMKAETPPFPSLQPMAERYVEITAEWLRTDRGREIVEIPATLDYGVRGATPMAWPILSFGGAQYGPTVGGRLSGYYVLTPPPKELPPEEYASRLASYNPYWTHVISYHEWLGHNVQRALAEEHVTRPMRAAYRGIYLSQAWSFYLEDLLPSRGYFAQTLPHLEMLKTYMAVLQMRMWRVQRILTKLRMARGEMSFEEAVQAYVDEIGMERANAVLEVQRDSLTPLPPAREILGEKLILEMRERYEDVMGDHYRMKDFHEALLSHGELPLPIVERLIFRR